MDIKKHILSMAPHAQDHLILTAIREGNLEILNQLIEIIGAKRDLGDLLATEMKRLAETRKEA